MPEPTRTPGGNLVVYEGESRGEWRRATGGWHFDGVWPDRQQQTELHQALAAGIGLLVVMPLTDATITVLRSETDLAGDDLAEVPVEALDWLNPAVRVVGLRFRSEAARLSAAVPALLRTPVSVSGDHHGIRFAVVTGRIGGQGPAFEDLADHLFTPTATSRRRWRNTLRRVS